MREPLKNLLALGACVLLFALEVAVVWALFIHHPGPSNGTAQPLVDS